MMGIPRHEDLFGYDEVRIKLNYEAALARWNLYDNCSRKEQHEADCEQWCELVEPNWGQTGEDYYDSSPEEVWMCAECKHTTWEMEHAKEPEEPTYGKVGTTYYATLPQARHYAKVADLEHFLAPAEMKVVIDTNHDALQFLHEKG